MRLNTKLMDVSSAFWVAMKAGDSVGCFLGNSAEEANIGGIAREMYWNVGKRVLW